MRKILCTTTVFLALCGTLLAAYLIRVPYWLWWDAEMTLWQHGRGRTMNLLELVFVNLTPIIFIIVGVGGGVFILWFAALWICSILQARWSKP
jgi:hypothetical protein